ncbi:MAG: thioredoxin [Armatimonadetes bacterium]|nr:thioredoxin [Armatimonadota bacterium]
MSEVITLNQETFQDVIGKSDKPVLVDFWAAWCGPCKMLAPVVDSIALEYAEKIRVAKVNTDDNRTVAEQFHVSGIPSLLLFKEGKLVDRLVGYVNQGSLKAFLDKHL